ncbi:MAG: hypothetical protein IJB70_08070 [Clostridia bacterium]|nr:hypothetical protein [Clostridia bacterium]
MKRKDKVSKTVFNIIICVSAVALFIMILASFLFWFGEIKLIDFEKTIESTLLSTGLAVISIALAVWAGLNIINAVSRKDIEKEQEKVYYLRKDLNKLKRESKFVFVDNKYVNFIELLRLLPDKEYPSKYFLTHFFEHRPNIEFIDEFEKIERYFYNVYNMHERFDNGGITVSKSADSAIKIISDVLSSKSRLLNGKEELYLNFRLAEFYFYKGYVCNTFGSAFYSFRKALELYFCTAPGFDIDIPHYNCDMELSPCKGNNIDLAIYYVNSIGEAYSKIVDKYISNNGIYEDKIDVHDYAGKSIFYCHCSVAWSNEAKCALNYEPSEVYYRNAGVALERYDKLTGNFGENSETIMKYYLSSFELVRYMEPGTRVQKSYHVVLSYMKKYFDKKLSLNLLDNSDNNGLAVFFKREFMLSDKDIFYLDRFCRISEFGKVHVCKFNLPHVMNGFAYVDVLVLKVIGNESVNKQYANSNEFYLQKIYDNICTFELLGVNDDYTKVLKRRYEALIELMREEKQE